MLFKTHLQHLTLLARNEGFKDHAWQRAKELDSDASGLFAGMRRELTLAVLGQASARVSVAPKTVKRR